MIKSRVSKKIHCNTCLVKNNCLGKDLDPADINQLNSIIKHVKYVAKKEQIYDVNTPANYIYALYQGSCKEYWINEGGQEIITNFYFAGDIIGLESIANKKFQFNTEALEDTLMCALPVENLLEFMKDSAPFLKRFITIMNQKMQHDHTVRSGTTAKEKICDFLLDIALRIDHELKKEINLTMSQIDIANFLGMTTETVNRTLNLLKRKKIIKYENKTVSFLNIAELQRLGKLDYTSQITPDYADQLE